MNRNLTSPDVLFRHAPPAAAGGGRLTLDAGLTPATLLDMIAALEWLVSPRFQDSALTAALWWFAVLWLATLGGCVGSFLNVVWDRQRTGRGIVFPPSECEECGHTIRWFHNVPVIGWLVLGGRCRDCGAPIPMKHPVVEAFFAALFAIGGILTPWL